MQAQLQQGSCSSAPHQHSTWEGHASVQNELAFAHRRHSAAEQGGGEQERAWP